MRTYLILKDKAAQWNADPEIRALLAGIAEPNDKENALGSYRKEHSTALLTQNFDRVALAAKGLQYERLDQLTIDILLGVHEKRNR